MRGLKKKHILTCILVTFLVASMVFFSIPPDKDRLFPKDFCSFVVVDRNGEILREVLSRNYATSVWTPLDNVSEWVIEATIAYEDKRFRSHPGVDVVAMFRAMIDNIKAGKIVSGGSTITMQVAKMTLEFKKRNLFTKLCEILYALKFELHLSKKEILEIYLNRAPYGCQNFGIGTASKFYLNKPTNHITLGEASLLATIPKSPSKSNPYINPRRAVKERNKLLSLMLSQNKIDTLSYLLAINEPIPFIPEELNFGAPHFVDYVLGELDSLDIEKPKIVVTSLDINLQEKFEELLITTLRSQEQYNMNQGAILVIDVETSEILVMVGSPDYFDPEVGQVNGCLAQRQPGSAIKPFTYILALNDGFTKASILPDIPMEFKLPGGSLFAPKNYSKKYNGPVWLKEALGASLNVPTVYLLERIGVERLYNLLKDLRFESIDKSPEFYGLSLTLGAAEVKLLELVRAYRAIAKGGYLKLEKPITEIVDTYDQSIELNNPKEARIFSEEVAYIITDILSDNSNRLKSFGEDNPLNLPFPCVAKTGTSKDYRDNWCVGFTNKYVVGVWIGNFDGSPMKGVSGISGAAPLFRDIMIELHKDAYPRAFKEPADLIHLSVCAHSGKLPNAQCNNVIEEIFIPGTEPHEICNECIKYENDEEEFYPSPYDMLIEEYYSEIAEQEKTYEEDKLRIITPANGDIFKIDPQVSLTSQAIVFHAVTNEDIEKIIFKLDGEILAEKSQPFTYVWYPKPGEHLLEVIPDIPETEKSYKVVFSVL